MHLFCRFFVASSITLIGKYSYYIATLEEADFWRDPLDPPRRNPKRPRRPEGINRLSIPPGLLVSEATVGPVMSPAERNGELVADLASDPAA